MSAWLTTRNSVLSTFNAVNINYSTLSGTASNTITTRQMNYSTLVGSTIVTNTMTMSGNVGIGITNPGSLLHVNNNDIIVTSGSNVAGAGGAIKFGIASYPNAAVMSWIQGTLENMYAGSSLQGQGGIGFYVTPVNNSATTSSFRAMTITSSGNVGIGTQSPFGILQIACTSSTNQANAPDGGGSHGLVFTSPKTGSSVYAMAMGVDFTTGYGYINGAGNSTGQPILLQSRGGNVGIGMTNPSTTLQVNGNTILGNMTGANTYGSTNSTYIIGNNTLASTTGSLAHVAQFGGGISNNFGRLNLYGYRTSTGSEWTTSAFMLRYEVDGTNFAHALINQSSWSFSGNVGIGTATVNAPLQFANTQANRKIVLYDEANNDHQYVGFGLNSATLRYQVDGVNGRHIFYAAASTTTSTELMRISGNGNVGIGITNPSSILHVNGTTTFGNGNATSNSNTNAGIISAAFSSGQAYGSTATNYYGTSLTILGGVLSVSVWDNSNYGGDIVLAAGDVISNENNGTVGGNYVGGNAVIRSGRVAVNNVAGNTQTVIPGSIYFQIGSGSRNSSSSLGGYNTAMTINSSGNVGIGTTNPTGTLQITSTYPQSGIWPGPTLNFQFNSGTGTYWMAGAIVGYIAANEGGTGGYPGGLAFQTKNPDDVIGTVPTTKMVIDSNGTVGIGTNNPNLIAKLYVYSTTAPTGWEGMGYFGNATAGFICGTYSNGVLIGGHVAALNNWANITIGAGSTTTSIPGALSKGSGTFDIAHPVYSDHKKRLVHSFIEGPRCDLIYRGTKQLINGTITIDINKECTYNPNGAMDDGTFEALCANAECFLQNKSSFARVMGTISGCILTITCENASNDTIVWMVIAERKDSFIKKWNRTDDNGFLITQYTDENHLDM